MAIRHDVIAASAARTATTNHEWSAPSGAKGAIFYVDVTAASGTLPTIDCKLQYKDQTGADFVDIDSATFTQLTAAGQVSLYVYPGLTADATGNQRRINDVAPSAGRVVATIGGTTPSFTYTIGVDWLN